jgi:anti-sigma B factor antagonist
MMTAEQKKRISFLESKLSNLQIKHLDLKKDEILYHQNDLSESFYMVLDGLVETGQGPEQGDPLSRRIKKDEFFGLRDILENKRRTETAVAIEKSELLQLHILDIDKNQAAAFYNELLKTQPAKELSTSFMDSAHGKNICSIRIVNGKHIVSFIGPHGNLSNAGYFKDILFENIHEGRHHLIVDLLACKTIDSTFLGTLIAALKKVSEYDGHLTLVCGTNLCSWLFVITQMDKVFKIYGSVEEAIAG